MVPFKTAPARVLSEALLLKSLRQYEGKYKRAYKVPKCKRIHLYASVHFKFMIDADNQKEEVLRSILLCSMKWMVRHLEPEANASWCDAIKADFGSGPVWNEVQQEVFVLWEAVKTIIRMEANDYDS